MDNFAAAIERHHLGVPAAHINPDGDAHAQLLFAETII
jgi:hypothetical protein